jgi:hypothetical protein
MLRHVALVRFTRRDIPEDGILHSHRRENLRSYILCIINLNLLRKREFRSYKHIFEQFSETVLARKKIEIILEVQKITKI